MKKCFYLLSVLLIPLSIIAQKNNLSGNTIGDFPRPWLLTGNKGTNSAINFIGTKDAQSLVFKVNNKKSGYIDYNASTANTAFGYQSLFLNTSINNTAFGYNTLSYNTNGQYNTAVGSYSLYLNTSGLGNTAVGALVLLANTTGSFNTAIGENSLIGNTTGYNNTATGVQTLAQNKTGSDNTAFGSLALYFNTGSANTANGSNALYDNTTGNNNTASGELSLYRNGIGSSNTATGSGAMFNNGTGNNNTGDGVGALSVNETGNNNTALGYNANVTAVNLTNATVIGFDALVDASNKVRIGNTSVTSIGGQVSWTNFSDERVKKDIQQNVPGLAFIKALRPVTYHYNLSEENKLSGGGDSLNWEGKNDIEKINFTGLIAQEVDAAAKKINYDFSGVDKTGKIWGLRYSDFVVPVIKALQELNDSLQTTNAAQQQQIASLQSRLDKIETTISQLQTNNISAQQSQVLAINSNSVLSVSPNPADKFLVVSMKGLQGTLNVKVYNSNGILVKTDKIANTNQYKMDVSQLISGMYIISITDANGKSESLKWIKE
jgi:trimeric autotransporter adhesin